MKKATIIIAIFAVFLWPFNYFFENQGLSFRPHHVFEFDYQAQQQILRNINVYPNIPLARMFQNKLVIISGKYLDGFFALIDPNYYFFGSHPREVINGQNYFRLPLLLSIPLLWYLLKFSGKSKKFVISFGFFTLLFLSLFTNYYKFDLVLWPFFLIMTTYGLIDIVKANGFIGNTLTVFIMIEAVFEYWKTLT